ncbi:hypothetical protein MKX01_030323 [Papaver californicum]|nr:hypothetical protein MKX01_030323 [Papaver californicum]
MSEDKSTARDLNYQEYHHHLFTNKSNYDPSKFNHQTSNNISQSSWTSSFHNDLNGLLGGSSSSSNSRGDALRQQLSFTDYLHGTSVDYNTADRNFNLPFSSLDVLGGVLDDNKNHIGGSKSSNLAVDSVGCVDITNNPVTPNSSSVSSSSTEAGGAGDDDSCNKRQNNDDQLSKGSEDGTDFSKNKLNKQKKKVDKKQKEPRFAFMTKSEVDHLEDGYRWRKYGQKAVKNSIYTRSYYRYTTQKCTVKKRVERSFQDPAVVITTYEGQHNHQSPATLRGNAARLLAPSMLTSSSPFGGSSSFPPRHQDLMLQIPSSSFTNDDNHVHDRKSSNYMYPQHNLTTTTTALHQQQLHRVLPDYGLLQDMVPSFNHNELKQQQP